jgi:alcohol dehydrogenase (cytochrome c)
MNHRTYDAQRYSPLDRINKAKVRNLKIAYAVAIGGTTANENPEATPLAEDGFLYITDQWGVLYKIDGRSGDAGRILWRRDPRSRRSLLSGRPKDPAGAPRNDGVKVARSAINCL